MVTSGAIRGSHPGIGLFTFWYATPAGYVERVQAPVSVMSVHFQQTQNTSRLIREVDVVCGIPAITSAINARGRGHDAVNPAGSA